MLTLDEAAILSDIRETRADNNDLWMQVLEIALRTNPEESKRVLKEILANDAQISRMLKELVT